MGLRAGRRNGLERLDRRPSQRVWQAPEAVLSVDRLAGFAVGGEPEVGHGHCVSMMPEMGGLFRLFMGG